MAEQGRKYAELVAKAWSDEAFKTRLKADPAAVLRSMGMQVPEGMQVEVLESTPQKTFVVIPPKPTDELSDDDLEKVAGGVCGKFDTFCGCCC